MTPKATTPPKTGKSSRATPGRKRAAPSRGTPQDLGRLRDHLAESVIADADRRDGLQRAEMDTQAETLRQVILRLDDLEAAIRKLNTANRNLDQRLEGVAILASQGAPYDTRTDACLCQDRLDALEYRLARLDALEYRLARPWWKRAFA